MRPTAEHPGHPAALHAAAAASTGLRSRRATARPRGPTANIVDVVYDAGQGTWLGYFDDRGPLTTVPGQIYALDANWVSRGYLDDECDGLVGSRAAGRD